MYLFILMSFLSYSFLIAWLSEYQNSYVSVDDLESELKKDIKVFNQDEKEKVAQLTDSTLDADGFVMAGGRKRIV